MRIFPAAAAVFISVAGASSAMAQMSPEQTAQTAKVPQPLQLSVWASEPQMVNPTNIDIDERGRIWVCEAANYRGAVSRPEGDRIMILEDTHHSGVCDSYKVFVQDKKLFAPLGICKLGNKLIVAQSPNVLVYTIDESGDHPVGEPQVLFTGFGGVNHDHGVHAGVFGPDGRFYFNCGNEGGNGLIKHGDGKPVIDITGSEVGSHAKIFRGKPKPRGFLGPRQGLAFSCNLDGSDFEVLAYDFRNNYELCVDSFGTVWQSDNDDDGNQGCTINYVMEGGDFGFTGPHGSDWMRDMSRFPGQTRQEAHWHQRWPGVVPNMLNTGQGAPCGICVYEADLLPDPYRNALIHADAGPNVVRAYISTPSEHVAKGIMNNDGDESELEKPGAGYKAQSIDLVKGTDSWFRPDDVCIAPDGAVYISDWYDPGVGGHATGDTGAHEQNGWRKLHGRIYRLAPAGFKPAEIKLDLSTTQGQIAALESPNLATRYLGYTRLVEAGDSALPALNDVFKNSPNPRFRARALWILARGSQGKNAASAALHDKDADIRVTAIRAARQIKMDMIHVAQEMLSDTSPAVLRELCLAMNFEPTDRALPVLIKLADKYDGTDRWYLEAFGIGCTAREAQLLDAWEKDHQNKDPKNNEGIRWRLKMDPVPLGPAAQAMAEPQLITGWWALGPFPYSDPDSALNHNFGPDNSPATIDLKAAYQSDGRSITWEQTKTIEGGPEAPQWVDFVKFCEDHHCQTESVVGYFATQIVADRDQQATLIVGSDDGIKIWLNGKDVLNNDAVRALNLGDDTVSVRLHEGPNLLLCKLRQGSGPSGIAVAVQAERAVKFSLDFNTKVAAGTPSQTGPAPRSKEGQALPSITELASLRGDAANGERVFRNANGANCIKCHQVGTTGGIVGPPLTTIGQKLNKAQLYEAILYPNAAIEMGYETWVVKQKDGQLFTGRKVEDTDDHLTILDADGKYHDISVEQIDRKVQQKISLMPEGLTAAMTRQELLDLVEYLSHLKA